MLPMSDNADNGLTLILNKKHFINVGGIGQSTSTVDKYLHKSTYLHM